MKLLLVYLALIAAGITGWVLNIVALIHADFSGHPSGMLIARVIGVFVAPLGAVLGFC